VKLTVLNLSEWNLEQIYKQYLANKYVKTTLKFWTIVDISQNTLLGWFGLLKQSVFFTQYHLVMIYFAVKISPNHNSYDFYSKSPFRVKTFRHLLSSATAVDSSQGLCVVISSCPMHERQRLGHLSIGLLSAFIYTNCTLVIRPLTLIATKKDFMSIQSFSATLHGGRHRILLPKRYR